MTEHEDYAHIRDPQSERTKWELWAIVAIVVVVIAGSIVWRVVTHHPAKPQTDWGRNAWPSHASAPANAPPAPPTPRPTKTLDRAARVHARRCAGAFRFL